MVLLLALVLDLLHFVLLAFFSDLVGTLGFGFFGALARGGDAFGEFGLLGGLGLLLIDDEFLLLGLVVLGELVVGLGVGGEGVGVELVEVVFLDLDGGEVELDDEAFAVGVFLLDLVLVGGLLGLLGELLDLGLVLVLLLDDSELGEVVLEVDAELEDALGDGDVGDGVVVVVVQLVSLEPRGWRRRGRT